MGVPARDRGALRRERGRDGLGVVAADGFGGAAGVLVDLLAGALGARLGGPEALDQVGVG